MNPTYFLNLLSNILFKINTETKHESQLQIYVDMLQCDGGTNKYYKSYQKFLKGMFYLPFVLIYRATIPPIYFLSANLGL